MSENLNNPPKRRKRIPYKKAVVNNPEPLPTVDLTDKAPVVTLPPVALVTADGVKRCRFDLFVRLHTGIPSIFKDQQRCWCFRGDTFTDQEHKMLRNLINIVKNHGHKYFLMELYDNNLPKEEGQRLILKIQQHTIRVNRLEHYSPMLTGFPLNDILQPYNQPANDKAQNSQG